MRYKDFDVDVEDVEIRHDPAHEETNKQPVASETIIVDETSDEPSKPETLLPVKTENPWKDFETAWIMSKICSYLPYLQRLQKEEDKHPLGVVGLDKGSDGIPVLQGATLEDAKEVKKKLNKERDEEHYISIVYAKDLPNGVVGMVGGYSFTTSIV